MGRKSRTHGGESAWVAIDDCDLTKRLRDSLACFPLQSSSPRGDRSMSPRMQPFSQLMSRSGTAGCRSGARDRRKTRKPLVRSLRMRRSNFKAEVPLGRPWRFEVMLMAVFSPHAKRLERLQMRLETINAEKHVPDGNPSDGGR